MCSESSARRSWMRSISFPPPVSASCRLRMSRVRSTWPMATRAPPAVTACASTRTRPPPLRIAHGAGDTGALDAAADLLAAASFPVIVAGGGVITASATQEAMALADTLGAAVCMSYLHKHSLPASHALAAGPLGYQGSKAAMKLTARADVVLALGTRLGPFGTLPQYGLDYWPTNAKIVQIDADPTMLGLVKPISVGICGDAKAATLALI